MPVSLQRRSPLQLRFSLSCDLDAVRPMAQSARETLVEQGVSEEELMACELSLVEACNNAVRYVTEEGRSQPIEVEITIDDFKIELKIQDNTRGFEMPQEIALPDEQSESGRGLFLMKSLMDEVTYSCGQGQNEMVMHKLRSPAKSKIIPLTLGATEEVVLSIEDYKRKLAESEQIIHDMAEELSSCYESLAAIFRCGAELGKTDNLEKFSRAFCEDLLQIASADWFVLRVALENESRLMVFTSSNPDLELDSLAMQPELIPFSVETKAALSRKDVWFGGENALESCDPLSSIQTDSSGLVHPCFFAETLVGTLTVGKAPGRRPFTSSQTNIIHTFADFLAIQIINSRLREEQVGNRLVSHELQIAKNIQRALLPKSLPRLPGFELAGYCESARQVGGDFYDALQVNDHSLLLIIADVMGKGIPAAMFAAILRSLVRAAPEIASQPAKLLARVNRLLFEELSDVEMFITAQLVYVDLEKRQFTAASAGHCPLLLKNGDDLTLESIEPDGMPLGILAETTFTDVTHELKKNSSLFLYTDGLTDARNAKGEFYGQQRLLEWLQKNKANNARQFRETLVEELRRFQSHHALYDDQTFLILTEESISKE